MNDTVGHFAHKNVNNLWTANKIEQTSNNGQRSIQVLQPMILLKHDLAKIMILSKSCEMDSKVLFHNKTIFVFIVEEFVFKTPVKTKVITSLWFIITISEF